MELLKHFSEHMTTKQIFDAWDNIGELIGILYEAVNNRLQEIDFDEDNYDWETCSDECDDLLSLRDTLDAIEF